MKPEITNRPCPWNGAVAKRIAEQETTIARLTIERDQARDVAERHVVQCSKLAADRDTARAQVDDLSTEVVKMNEEIRQLRGMIH